MDSLYKDDARAQRPAHVTHRRCFGGQRHSGLATGSVKFFFGNQASPQILTKLESYVATPKTSAMAKSDQGACHEALLWTLVAMEKRAQQKGANAVVNIASFYKKHEISSATEFECHVGNVIVSVVLKGDLVKIAAQ
jgi:uncharacterized protein YbjQ (UPF0145 family)